MCTKKALIFTASTGGGHNQAANALKNQLMTQEFDVEIISAFKEHNRFLETFIEDGYSLFANYAPALYGGIYKWSNHQTTNKSLRKLFYTMLKRKMLHTIQMYQPDLLISTHPLFVHIIAELKREKLTTASCLSVITDLGVHRFYLHQEIDAYVTGSKATSKQLESLGIHMNKIHDFGIPVRENFYHTGQNRGNTPFTVLLMGGSMGSKKLLKTLKYLMKVKHPIRIFAVCGNNKELYNQVELMLFSCPSHIDLKVFGFTKHVDMLMDESDLLISKPGGLTLTEAINKRLPMIIPFYIHGQEAENTEILVQMGLGLQIKELEELPSLVDSLVDYPATLEKMRYNMNTVAENYSVEKIGFLCEALLA